MKSKLLNLMWLVRIVGVIALMAGMIGTSSPVLAAGTPDLAISVTHVGGDFAQGEQYRSYTITVTNNGDTATFGTITVTDTVPAGLTPWDISGSGWSCPAQPLPAAPTTLTCTSTASIPALGSSSITFITDVDVNAGVGVLIDENPIYLRTLTNSVSVSGGGDTGPDPDATASENTRIIQKPDLLITAYKLLNEAKTAEINTPDPDTSFWVRMTVKNRGGLATGLFYPGVFLDNKPNYGKDHAVFGQITSFSDFKMTPPGAFNGVPEGALYYDPTGAIDPLTTMVDTERGNYTRSSYNDSIDPNTSVDVDVHIAYPASEPDYNYPEWIPYRNGLPQGTYKFTLYADPDGSGGAVESFEDNNSLGPITVGVGTHSFTTGPATVNVFMGGGARGQYTVAENGQTQQSYTSVASGPVKITGNGNSIVMTERVIHYFGGVNTSYYEMMGLPDQQLSTEYWYPYTTNVGVNTQIRFGNAGNTTATVEVRVAGVLQGTYSVAPNSIGTATYYNLVGGPVQVTSTNGVPIISTERFIFTTNGVTPASFAETMGMPKEQLGTEYWFPIYNNSTINSQLRIANAGATTASVQIFMGGGQKGSTLSIAPNTTSLVSFAGLAAGPVKIVSTNGVPIVVTERVIHYFGGVNTSYYEMMALPASQLSTEYWYPYTTNVGVNTQIRFGNAGNSTATVEVRVGGALQGTYSVAPNSIGTATYYNLVGGPVQVTSTNGVPITSTERFIFTTNGVTPASFAETMGMPTEQLSDTYWFPIYNNLSINSQIRIGNP